VKLSFLHTVFGFLIYFIGLSLTHAQQIPSNAIEIIIDGKQYGSVHEYRRERIKIILIKALAADDLQAFTEEELFDIMKEVREQQTADMLTAETDKAANSLPDLLQQNQQSNEEDILDLNYSQMEEMLKDYLNKHQDADPVIIDSNKVKSIMIKPKADPKDTLLD